MQQTERKRQSRNGFIIKIHSMTNEIVDLELRIVYETDKAYFLTDQEENSKSKRGTWVPKSAMEIEKIKDGSKKGVRMITFAIPRWLAKQKELV